MSELTVVSFRWVVCPNCESQHLVAEAAGETPVQYGLLATNKEGDETFYTFTYWSRPDADRTDEYIQLELYTDDEAGLKMQALMIAVNGMALAVPLEGSHLPLETKH